MFNFASDGPRPHRGPNWVGHSCSSRQWPPYPLTVRPGIGPNSSVDAQQAREWWKALMGNAVSLLEDAAVLLESGSVARARSLAILSLEELAKARWLYEQAEFVWSAGVGVVGYERWADRQVSIPGQLQARRRSHDEKLRSAEQFASGLDGFWGYDDRATYYPADLDTFEVPARRLNEEKQAGFYVDRVDGQLTSPQELADEGVVDFVVRVAQTVEMHLIEDHTRQQDAPEPSRIDSSQDLHWRVMPLAHASEFFEFFEGHSGPADTASDQGDLGRTPDDGTNAWKLREVGASAYHMFVRQESGGCHVLGLQPFVHTRPSHRVVSTKRPPARLPPLA